MAQKRMAMWMTLIAVAGIVLAYMVLVQIGWFPDLG